MEEHISTSQESEHFKMYSHHKVVHAGALIGCLLAYRSQTDFVTQLASAGQADNWQKTQKDPHTAFLHLQYTFSSLSAQKFVQVCSLVLIGLYYPGQKNWDSHAPAGIGA